MDNEVDSVFFDRREDCLIKYIEQCLEVNPYLFKVRTLAKILIDLRLSLAVEIKGKRYIQGNKTKTTNKYSCFTFSENRQCKDYQFVRDCYFRITQRLLLYQPELLAETMSWYARPNVYSLEKGKRQQVDVFPCDKDSFLPLVIKHSTKDEKLRMVSNAVEYIPSLAAKYILQSISKTTRCRRLRDYIRSLDSESCVCLPDGKKVTYNTMSTELK